MACSASPGKKIDDHVVTVRPVFEHPLDEKHRLGGIEYLLAE